ncbi:MULTISPECIES: YdeI/OmpD-associated family protein [Olivibacter]|jgi:uncharacterized protein YdeI (YjbR/CyaY-like superfamily)|uniref:YdeI family protein n=1 Tax=Olivibacter oleidegradans TaxID=760123 RepID=A0ABV6HLM3_9SPHI|nr:MULTISPECIES: DUF1801 domain-containing protein [Olivibacter]MDM8175817.1 YdeI/OmpD-associated family protein [Olivibacter sp. 47]MDX3914423.1 YdeI/OmpD-associated family protein [Pseudosphingobacterium sp.]QEL02545.1 hypothetical protein FKG96_17565 [Olivibacter sp. LS-1]
MESFKSSDDFYRAQQQWRDELYELRKLIVSTGLKEELKWGGPVYTHNGKNIVGLAGFKSYFGIWFYQGVFLKDPHHLLINAQNGTTKALRQMRFTTLEEANLDIIRTYVLEAMSNQEKGIAIKADRNKPIIVPQELNSVFDKNPELKECFDQLKKTQQREFTEYIESAKQETTKKSRLEKIIPMIIKGVGLHDKYRG